MSGRSDRTGRESTPTADDPTQGFRFSDLTRENFGKILTKPAATA